mmetsp:Transcript_21336/g.84864  ORF Transcript_21336/g.84864 Transcript_21336/m.84864 type:complete len:261 (+) Transcript_21336:181-963(+)
MVSEGGRPRPTARRRPLEGEEVKMGRRFPGDAPLEQTTTTVVVHHADTTLLEVVRRELREAEEREELREQQEEGGDARLEEVADRLLGVHEFGAVGVGVRADEAVLVHREGAEHDLDPEPRVREEDREERRQGADLLGEVVAVDLKVDEPFDAFGVVPEAVLPVLPVGVGDGVHRAGRRQRDAAVEHEGEELGLHLGGRRDRAEGGPREAEEGEFARLVEGAEDLLVQFARVLAEERVEIADLVRRRRRWAALGRCGGPS